MLKLILCLTSALLIGIGTLQMRQQQMELKHQSARLQHQVEKLQAKLWNQQLQIAVYTAPNSIVKTIGTNLDLVPEADLPPEVADWMRMGTATDREVARGR